MKWHLAKVPSFGVVYIKFYVLEWHISNCQVFEWPISISPCMYAEVLYTWYLECEFVSVFSPAA